MSQDKRTVSLGIVGVGKIARDEHLPSIGRNSDFALIAAASRHATLEGLPGFSSLGEMLDARPDIEAVSLCTPPQVRYDLARQALAARKHVLLEKPPGVTLSEVEALKSLAREAGVTIYATWHSRHAAGVEQARRWLTSRQVRHVHIVWKEDVTHWHPGQEWIWEPGGLGVFDPGINALSILTEILPFPVRIVTSQLEVPSNRSQPIAARLEFAGPDDASVLAEFDWRQKGPQSWDIRVETVDGGLTLSHGGSRLSFDGEAGIQTADDGASEYDRIYTRFARLIAEGRSDLDISPLRHVADAFMLARQVATEPFIE